MAITADSQLVDFDADRAVERGRETAGEGFLSAVEYILGDDFRSLYVADEVLAMYNSREHMESHFEEISSYQHVDEQERDLFEREIAVAGEVRYFVTRMRYATIVRLMSADRTAGVWVTLSNQVSAVETAEAMLEVVGTADDGPSPY